MNEKAPDWIGRPVVACVDGPMVNQWFFADDWAARLEAARYRLGRGGRRSPELDYVRDGVKRHPQWPEYVQGAAMYYRPGRNR